MSPLVCPPLSPDIIRPRQGREGVLGAELGLAIDCWARRDYTGALLWLERALPDTFHDLTSKVAPIALKQR